MSGFTVSSADLASHNRMDASFHAAIQKVKARTDELREAYLSHPEDAMATLRSFPADLVHTACKDLATHAARERQAEVVKSAEKEPYAALALIELEAPAYLEQLEAERNKMTHLMNCVEQGLVDTTDPRRPKP